jgi:hypothetical protein
MCICVFVCLCVCVCVLCKCSCNHTHIRIHHHFTRGTQECIVQSVHIPPSYSQRAFRALHCNTHTHTSMKPKKKSRLVKKKKKKKKGGGGEKEPLSPLYCIADAPSTRTAEQENVCPVSALIDHHTQHTHTHTRTSRRPSSSSSSNTRRLQQEVIRLQVLVSKYQLEERVRFQDAGLDCSTDLSSVDASLERLLLEENEYPASGECCCVDAGGAGCGSVECHAERERRDQARLEVRFGLGKWDTHTLTHSREKDTDEERSE